MNRKWIFAVVSVLAVALAMFPLNLLWVGQSPLHAAVSSLLFGLPALLTAWTPKGRCAGARCGCGIPQGCREYGIPHPHRAPGSHCA